MTKHNKAQLFQSIVATLLATILFLAFCLDLFVLASTKKECYVLTPYVVENGDTLWDVAQTFRNEEEDVRDVVDRIREYNQITPDIHAGDEFFVPVLVDRF